MAELNPKLCDCGCGNPAPIAKTNANGYKIGQPKRYVRGHFPHWVGKPPKPRIPLSERFWKRVTVAGEDECWLWTGSTRSFGYGTIRLGNALISSHRASWIVTHGQIPESLCVLHKCDNPPCVNPRHLFLGTRSANTKDCSEKKRHNQSRKTHCYRGHPLSGRNLRIAINGARVCRACKCLWARERTAAKRRLLTPQSASRGPESAPPTLRPELP